jgi:uncharacterized protein YktA (UPF0223 family)
MSEVFLTPLEIKLLESDYDSFSLSDKNTLIAFLANKEGLKYSDITDEYILDYHRQLKIDILSEKCDEIIVKGFVSANGHTYRTNRDDQLNMVAKNVQLLHDETILEVNWKTEDVGYVLHTRAEWLQVYNEGVVHKETNLYKYNTLKAQVASATTHAEILAVAWA